MSSSADQGVEIRRVHGRFYPCEQCIYRHHVKSHKDGKDILMYNSTHAIVERWLSFSPNIKMGQGKAYSEIIGTCTQFKPQHPGNQWTGNM